MTNMIHSNHDNALFTSLVHRLIHQRSLYNISQQNISFLLARFHILIQSLPNEIMIQVIQSAHLYINQEQQANLKQMYETHEEEQEMIDYFNCKANEAHLDEDVLVEEITIEGIEPHFVMQPVHLFSGHIPSPDTPIVGSSTSAFSTPNRFISPYFKPKINHESPKRITDLEEADCVKTDLVGVDCVKTKLPF